MYQRKDRQREQKTVTETPEMDLCAFKRHLNSEVGTRTSAMVLRQLFLHVGKKQSPHMLFSKNKFQIDQRPKQLKKKKVKALGENVKLEKVFLNHRYTHKFKMIHLTK